MSLPEVAYWLGLGVFGLGSGYVWYLGNQMRSAHARILRVTDMKPEDIMELRGALAKSLEREKVLADMLERAQRDLWEAERSLQEERALSERQRADMQAQIDQLRGQITALQAELNRYTRQAPNSLRVVGVWSNDAGDLDLRADLEALFTSGGAWEYSALGPDEPVTRTTIAEELARRGRCDILYFAGHTGRVGRHEGFLLADGQIVTASWLRDLHQLYGISLVVLNTCSSLHLADAVRRAGVPAVVAMRKKVLDADAIDFVKGFFSALASGHSVARAAQYAQIAMDSDEAARLVDCQGDFVFTEVTQHGHA